MAKRLLCILVISLLLSTSFTHASEKEVFSFFPSNTLSILRLASIQQGSNHVNRFVLPAAGLPLGSEIEKLVLDALDLETLDGIDRERPLWLLAEQKEDFDINLAMVVSLSDSEALLSSAKLEKKAENEYSTGKRSFIVREDRALFCDGKIKESLKEWFLNADLPQLDEYSVNASDDLSLWIQTPPLVKELRNMMDVAMEGMQGIMAASPFSSPNTVPLLNMEAGWLLDLLDQTELVRLSLRFSPEAAEIHKRIVLKEGAPATEFLKSAKYSDPSAVTSLFNDDNLLSMIANVDPQVYALVKDRMVNDFKEINVPTQSMEEMVDFAVDAYQGSIGATFDVADDLTKPVSFTQLIAIKDASKALEIVNRMAKTMQESAGMMMPATGIRIEITEEKEIGSYKKIPYSKISMRYKVDDPESPLAKAFEKQNIDYFYAVTGKLMIMTSENMPDVLDRALASDSPNAPKFMRDRSFLDMRVNLLQVLKSVKQHMAQNMKGINPLQMVEIPPNADNPGIIVNVRVEDGDLESTLTIPVKEVQAVRNAVLGGMMQQNGMGQQ